MANISLVNFTIKENGDLTISKKQGVAYPSFNGTYEQEYQEIQQNEHLSDDNKFGELIEHEICNGYNYCSDASYYGNLSNAPIIWEAGDMENGPEYDFWYDNNYMLRSAFSEFMETGKVTFTLVK